MGKKTIRKNTRKPSRKMNKKTNKKTMRKYGKKGGFGGPLARLVHNNAAHTTDIPYTTPRPIIPMFETDALITPYGKNPPQSVLDEYTNIDDTPPKEFIFLNEGNIPPPPKNPRRGKQNVVFDNNKNNNNPLNDFKKKYNWLNAYIDEVDKRNDNLHKNVEKAKEAINSNPNDKKV